MNIIKTLYRSCSRVSDMIDKVLKVILVLLVLGSALDLFCRSCTASFWCILSASL